MYRYGCTPGPGLGSYKAVCFCIWVFGLAMGIPTATYRTVQYSPAFKHAACIIIYPLDSLKVAHSLQLNLLGFALPLLAIVFCSCNIVRALHKRKENVHIQDGNDWKATVLVCAVTLLFLLCWGPFHIVTFLDTLCELHKALFPSNGACKSEVRLKAPYICSTEGFDTLKQIGRAHV